MRMTTKAFGIVALCLPLVFSSRIAEGAGNDRYVPNQLEWLGLVVNAAVKHQYTREEPFFLSVVPSGFNTLTIFVKYHPSADREGMNLQIEAAREVVRITANSYGWGKWLKVVERVEMVGAERR